MVDRRNLQSLSDAVKADYGRMLGEMTLAETPGHVTPNAGPAHYYVRVVSLASSWKQQERPLWEMMGELTRGLFAVDVEFSVVFACDGTDVLVYIGCEPSKLDVLMGMMRGIFPQAGLETNDQDNPVVVGFREVNDGRCRYGGFVKGNPVGWEDFQGPSQIDSVIQGMSGKRWVYSVFAQPLSRELTVMRQQCWLAQANKSSALAQVTFSDTDNRETTSHTQRYLDAEQYVQKVEAFCDRALEAVSMGEWCVTCNYAAETDEAASLLGGLLSSAFYGEDSQPETVHAIRRIGDARAPLVNGWEYAHHAYLGQTVPFPRYSTFLSSGELAVYVAFPTMDTTGIAIVDDVTFDVHREAGGDLVLGSILNAGRPSGASYALDSNELNRHCLVVGLTGSGKTNTIKCLIHALARGKNLPFMMIEPAKKEYWELYGMGFDDLQIYSVGSNEGWSRTLCINPFERATVTGPDGRRHAVPIQTHIDFVYAAFKASFIMYTPMPYVLERAIYEIYEDCGWDIHNDTNTNGEDEYPTIEDLYFKIPEVVNAMGYDQKMRRDLIGSLQARINSLRIGSKGDTLNVAHSFPFDELLSGHVVVELEDIGDDDAKAFIISLLLVNLLEVRRQQEDCQLELRHVMLIEEAHRLLRNVQGGTGEDADPRAAAVEFFCNLLAELRSKGQGFIVADQIPSKLAPDLVKNTNLKIAHRLVAQDERELMGGAMHMRDDQIDYLASLKQGVAAVYSEGDFRPKLVRPPFAGSFGDGLHRASSRDDVLVATVRNGINAKGNPRYQSLTDSRSEVCRRCKAHCRKRPEQVLERMRSAAEFERVAASLDPDVTHTCKASTIDAALKALLQRQIVGWDGRSDSDRYCLLNLLLDRWSLSDSLRGRLIDAYFSL